MSDQIGINLDFFMNEDNKVNLSAYPEADNQPTKKRGRPKKTTGEGVEYVQAEQVTPLSMAQSNEPYLDSYQDTNALINGTIGDVNELYGAIRQDVETIRTSKTIRNKYNNLATLVGTESALLSTKLAAIKELNKVKTDSHNLELKRLGGSLAAMGQQQDDTKVLSDMYNALIQTPIGAGGNPFGMPSSQDITLGAGTGLVRSSLDASDLGYSQFINNPSPEQATVMASNNPNIKTVVIYDEYAPVGQNVRFDVIDSATGQSVPNVPRPDSMFLGDLKLEPDIGIAMNNNLGTQYDLITVNNNVNQALNQY